MAGNKEIQPSNEDMQRRQLMLSCEVLFVSILTRAWWQETLNFWKQIPHVMKFFRDEENPDARLPANFMQGFLEVGTTHDRLPKLKKADSALGAQLIVMIGYRARLLYIEDQFWKMPFQIKCRPYIAWAIHYY